MTLENIVYACYEEHKTHTSNWQHGKPQADELLLLQQGEIRYRVI